MANIFKIKKFVVLDQDYELVPGPDSVTVDVYKKIQSAIDDGTLTTSDGTPIGSSNLQFKRILTGATTFVDAFFSGTEPTAAISGGSNEVVVITCPTGCTPVSFQVTGDSAETASTNRTVTFTGAGIPGNTSTSTLYIPGIQKVNASVVLGAPATSNPYTVDNDNSPAIQVVGVGSSGSPSISIRFVGISAFSTHKLKFNW